MIKLSNYIKMLQNTIVEKANTGGGAGSIVKIELESSDFFFVYCTWRVEQDNKILATSEDDSTAQVGLMARTIKQLEKLKIKDIDLSPQYDLSIVFENNYKFIAFCNLSYSNDDNYNINWELCSPVNNIVYKIDNHFKEEIESYY